MSSIKINVENIISKEELNNYKKVVYEIHNKIEKEEGEGNEFLGWKDLPENFNKDEFKKIENKANFLIKNGIEVLVVIGIGGSFTGIKAGIDFVLGNLPSKNERKMEVIFAGTSFSSTDLAQKLKYVENKKFAINVISKSGTTTEPAIAFRMFKKLLEDKIGINNAKDFIISTTDANKGALFTLSKNEGYEMFVIPDNIGGRFSVLTAVGLFPFACSGINIKSIMKGAQIGYKNYRAENLEDNDAYKYAVTRYNLYKKSKLPVEVFIGYEPNLLYFIEWWKQLFGESEGKLQKGIFPVGSIFSTDLHSIGQFIQEGSKVLFETVLLVEKPLIDLQIVEDRENLDGLNYLINNSLHQINEIAAEATLAAHSKIGNVKCIEITVSQLDEYSFGELIYFFEVAVAMSGYLLEVNPFNQPGVEIYKNNMFKLLKKPNFE
ncbi:MAG: glucose-6-phosphate isomerase [Metamycoplasmataceae bacterium]